MKTLDDEKLDLANDILSRPAKTWIDRREQIEEALRLADDDYAIDALEQRAKILYGSYGGNA